MKGDLFPVEPEQKLALAVEQYLEERGLLLNPEDARDQCYVEAAYFAEVLMGHGIHATAVSGLKMGAGGGVLAGHFAVRVGDQVWDWTFRQFDPECEVPTIIPWSTWQKQFLYVQEGWIPDPVARICDCELHFIETTGDVCPITS